MLAALADQCSAWIARWENGRAFSVVRDAWLSRAGSIGEPITIQTASRPVSGTYQGLAPSGALLAAIAGRIETISYGDVALIAPTGKGNG